MYIIICTYKSIIYLCDFINLLFSLFNYIYFSSFILSQDQWLMISSLFSVNVALVNTSFICLICTSLLVGLSEHPVSQLQAKHVLPCLYSSCYERSFGTFVYNYRLVQGE